MLVKKIFGILILILNTAGIVYLLLIGVRFLMNRHFSSRIPVPPEPGVPKKIKPDIVNDDIVPDEDDLLKDIDLSDLDDLDLDDLD